MDVAFIVPARIGSTRFPKKLLHRIKDKPVIVWTADRIKKEAPEFPLYFAVDHESLAEVLRREGYEAIMTDPAHTCGTDRIAEANRRLKARFVINVQADEPLVTGGQIRQLVELILTGADFLATGQAHVYAGTGGHHRDLNKAVRVQGLDALMPITFRVRD